MARWVVFENNKGNLGFLYKNRINGTVHNCGELRRDTTEDMIVEWIFKEGNPAPGDIIQFDSGTFLHISYQQTANA